jgi:hypothetical protein
MGAQSKANERLYRLLDIAIRAEKKSRSPDRCLALSKVLSYNETPCKVCFSGVDPSVFAFQLALHIREPSLLNQKSLGVFGDLTFSDGLRQIASVAVQAARDAFSRLLVR